MEAIWLREVFEEDRLLLALYRLTSTGTQYSQDRLGFAAIRSNPLSHWLPQLFVSCSCYSFKTGQHRE